MVGHSFPETPCTICARPVDLSVDLFADENGKAVHEDCYVKRVIAAQTQNCVGAMND
jgi:hypothetical protein